LYPSDHSSYTAEVELFIEGNATGGLILFYNNSAYSGILADNAKYIGKYSWLAVPTEKNVIKKSCIPSVMKK